MKEDKIAALTDELQQVQRAYGRLLASRMTHAVSPTPRTFPSHSPKGKSVYQSVYQSVGQFISKSVYQ